MFAIAYFGGIAVTLLLFCQTTRKATLSVLIGGIAAAGYFLLGWGLI